MPNNAARHIAPAKNGLGSANGLAFILPCAGAGTRMKSYGPKALITVNGMTIIERQIRLIWEVFPAAEIIIPVGFDSTKMRKALDNYDVRMVLNPLHETTNVAFSIGLGLYATNAKAVVVCNGDLVYNKVVLQSLADCKNSSIVTAEGMTNDEVGLITQGGKVINLAYGLEDKWSQIALFKVKELKLLRNTCFNEENNKWFAFEALNHIISKNGKFKILTPEKAIVCDIDNPKDIEVARKIPLTI